jgi:hypothetical protein
MAEHFGFLLIVFIDMVEDVKVLEVAGTLPSATTVDFIGPSGVAGVRGDSHHTGRNS